MGSPSIAAFGGLARVLVQVSADCTNDAALTKTIDIDGGVTTEIPTAAKCDQLAGAGIVVGVSLAAAGSDGGGGSFASASASVTIDVSTDEEKFSAMSEAHAGSTEPLDFSYLTDFVG